MTKTQKYKITLERENCIGAANCIQIYPKRWELLPDGKANLKGATRNKENKEVQELEITTKEFEQMKQTAKNCPVNAIHIYETKNNKKLI